MHLATRASTELDRDHAGRIDLSRKDFARIGQASLVIEDLHRSTPKGQRPDADRLADLLYDALDAASAEVTLKPLEMVKPAR